MSFTLAAAVFTVLLVAFGVAHWFDRRRERRERQAMREAVLRLSPDWEVEGDESEIEERRRLQ
jgi:uncharacterized protein HemY